MYTIGQVSQLFGVPISTLRYYDKEGLFPGLEGWVECFPRAALAGTVFAGGITDQGDIQGHPALKRAYDMGAGIK